MRLFSSLLLFLLLTIAPGLSGQSQLNLTDIWQRGVYSARTVPGFNFRNDGRHYARIEGQRIVQYDLTTGQPDGVLFDAGAVAGIEGAIDGYRFNADETALLLEQDREAIYRRSSKANFFLFDQQTRSARPLYETGKQMYATFNPQADKVAFVYENDLYYRDLRTDVVVRVTTDGEQNRIINGALDWVYEEEFGFAQGFQWSPDGKKIAYYRFDESAVKEFTMPMYRNELYPEYVTFKYPKVGERNSTVQVFIYDVEARTSVSVDLGEETDQYIPRIKWTNDPDQLCVYRLNRLQNHLELLLADAQTGRTRVLLEETNPYYISESVLDNLTFLANGTQFLWSSEQDGWHHLYLYDMQGNLLRQLTRGQWEVTALYGVDEANGQVYFQAAMESPLERQIYRIGLDGRNRELIAGEPGWNDAQFSSTFDYFVLDHSTINRPPTYRVFDRQGELLRTIEDNGQLAGRLERMQVPTAEFFYFRTPAKVELNGYLIKPADFDPKQKYPVFMFLYGGPGSQQVTDRWGGERQVWFRMLAEQGFIVACVDNRGTGARGEAFKKMTYLQLGKYETEDQIEAAKYLAGLDYTDPDRVGVFGWSYGGYLSSLCLLKGAGVFSAAIAVAPVTNWKWYDTIYTERYMRTEKDNPDGYRDNSPVNFAKMLRGNYLLIHGMGDDNVHFQHTAEMANALIDANKQFDTYFYPNRNHGIYGGNTRLHLYQKMTDFLMEHLHKPMAKAADLKLEKRPTEGLRKAVTRPIKKNEP